MSRRRASPREKTGAGKRMSQLVVGTEWEDEGGEEYAVLPSVLTPSQRR
jgi:hypothetical protein